MRLGCAMLCLFVLVLSACLSFAETSYYGKLTTVVEYRDDHEGDISVPIYQYVLLNARDFGKQGHHFRAYGRLGGDATGESDAGSRLYYAYFEDREILPHLGFRLGRQLVVSTAGATVMDGIDLRVKDVGPFGLELFGGPEVSYEESYEPDDLITGFELTGRFIDSLHLGLSYVQTWDSGDLAKELLGAEADFQYEKNFNCYAEYQYSLLAESPTYFLGGFKLFSAQWSLRSHYLYSLPVFESTSIYSVFAVEEYEEVMAEMLYSAGMGVRLFARYTRELYDEFADANVFEVGMEKIRTRRFSGYLTYMLRDDSDGQGLNGVKARAAYRFSDRWSGGIGAHVDVLERWSEEDEYTLSQRYWADVTSYLTKRLSLSAKFEVAESELYNRLYHGRLRLAYRF